MAHEPPPLPRKARPIPQTTNEPDSPFAFDTTPVPSSPRHRSAGRPKSNPNKKLIVIIAGVVGGLLLLCGGGIGVLAVVIPAKTTSSDSQVKGDVAKSRPGDAPPISDALYDQIQLGMTTIQVRALVGGNPYDEKGERREEGRLGNEWVYYEVEYYRSKDHPAARIVLYYQGRGQPPLVKKSIER